MWSILAFFVLHPFLKRNDALTKAGEWTVITGATTGIGKAFAELLAKKGPNIFLTGLSEDELKSVASKIGKVCKVKTSLTSNRYGYFYSSFDLLLDLQSFRYLLDNLPYKKPERQVESLSSVSCLNNNVGKEYPYPNDFATCRTCGLFFIRSVNLSNQLVR
ncbi:hypothetical protein Aperf_G00000088713 [Anoplocephala perfoliata]